jgi:hypothetical protein
MGAVVECGVVVGGSVSTAIAAGACKSDGVLVDPTEERGVAMTVPRHDEAWSARHGGNGKLVAEMYHEDGVRFEVAHGVRLEGRTAIAETAQGYLDAVPDAVCEWRKVSEAPNGTVTIEWTWRGTHTGNSPDWWPPKNEDIYVEGVSVCDMDDDLIREERVYWDWKTILGEQPPSQG